MSQCSFQNINYNNEQFDMGLRLRNNTETDTFPHFQVRLASLDPQDHKGNVDNLDKQVKLVLRESVDRPVLLVNVEKLVNLDNQVQLDPQDLPDHWGLLDQQGREVHQERGDQADL